jgi:DNA polymerase V
MQIALCDCNNFYASCEVAFQPKLRKLSLVVLSSNDGCVVARSPAAKALGIRMGEPFFKVQQLIEHHHVQVFSSNYSLYGDMSQRVMVALAQFTPVVEIYSIDEAFLDLSGFEWQDLTTYGQHIRDLVRQWTGISVSIGVAPTKTLAKVANRIAKKFGSGVCDLAQLDTDQVLSGLDVEDIWGIGRRYAKSLRSHGIETALQLRDTDLVWAKQKYSVVMQRTILELRGKSCIPIALAPPSRQSVMVSRSFGRPVTEQSELKEAIATQDTAELLFYALRGVERIYRSDHAFTKAGVLLLELQPESLVQGHLFEHRDQDRSQLLMQTIDNLNRQFGARTVQFAAAGLKKGWSMRQGQRSQRWTTCWEELLVVRA